MSKEGLKWLTPPSHWPAFCGGYLRDLVSGRLAAAPIFLMPHEPSGLDGESGHPTSILITPCRTPLLFFLPYTKHLVTL